MIGQGTTQAPADPSYPSSYLGIESHIPASTSVIDANNLGNMLGCSPLPAFDSAMVASPPAYPNSTDHRRPPLKAPHPSDILKCPRCNSFDTKFCYYNNYSLTQPRYFCKNCKRYWTAGGALRNVPVGGGLRKNKRSKLKLAAEAEAAMAVAQAFAGGAGATAPVNASGQLNYYQGKAMATSSLSPASEIMDKVENRAIVPVGPTMATSSGSMYTHVMPATTSSFRVGEYAGIPAGNYEACDHQKSSGSAVIVSSEQECARDDDQQGAMVSFYSEPPQPVPHFYSSYAPSVSILPNTDCHSQFSNAGAEGSYMQVNFKFIEEEEIPVKRKESILSTGDNGGQHASKRVTMAEQDNDNGRAGAEEGGDGSAATSTTYDWQVLSEELFNGRAGATTDSSGFFYVPSSSWPDDFAHFNDNSINRPG